MGAEHETTPKSPAGVNTENEEYSKVQVIYKKRTTPRAAAPDNLAQETGYQKIDDEDESLVQQQDTKKSEDCCT